ncbi:putative D-alanyl-D-alanine dipeptidase [Pseudomonas phage PAP02]|uniref:putative D-alanyl-D-alanine dipeptidase n=1 Tax=Pseudomonas phage PAP02 TaxID=2713224 RepID=UPI0023292C79|nr:putative D-alanyl-D-alanine dipeptidase [Pseudomonas phage PAP02]QKE55131.1 putative D-alanyl-D-alanine dipeptidase [Pseudomonas phage PAP02]
MEQRTVLNIKLPGQQLVEIDLNVPWKEYQANDRSNHASLNAMTIADALWKYCEVFQLVPVDPAQQKIAELEAKVKELEDKLKTTSTEESRESFLCRVASRGSRKHADIVKKDGLFYWVGTIRGTTLRMESTFMDADFDPVFRDARDWVKAPLLLKENLGVLTQRDQVRNFRLEVYWAEATGLFTGVATNLTTGLTFVAPVKFKTFKDSWKDIHCYIQGKE